MIGYIRGKVLFSDGQEAVLLTASGVGYQIFYSEILPEGKEVSLFVSHIIRESSQELYGLPSLKAKKLFEMLISVRGVGPKSAYALVGFFSVEQIINAITCEDKKLLTGAPGIGPKAAAQIILDLNKKIGRIMMYSDNYKTASEKKGEIPINTKILQDTISACKTLGFNEQKIIPIANKILSEHTISKAEQLVHLVLKEI